MVTLKAWADGGIVSYMLERWAFLKKLWYETPLPFLVFLLHSPTSQKAFVRHIPEIMMGLVEILLGPKGPTCVHNSVGLHRAWMFGSRLKAPWSRFFTSVHQCVWMGENQSSGLFDQGEQHSFYFCCDKQVKRCKISEKSLWRFGRTLKWDVENIKQKGKQVSTAGKLFQGQLTN